MQTPAMWTLALAGGLVYFIHTGVNIHQAAFLRDHGISPSIAASALTVKAGGTAIGSIFWGNLLDRLPVKVVYTATAGFGFGGNSPIIPSGKFSGNGVHRGSTFWHWPRRSTGSTPCRYSPLLWKKLVGAIRGGTEPFVSGGQALGAVGAGLIYDLSGSYQGTFPTFTGAAIIAIILLVATRRPNKHKDTETVAEGDRTS
ncbi:MAG: hypothetical protein Ct9H300mP19_03410 [Dehalococcoidia bacterium]|nr:MAG: hypothetical protein Ct9H300mP19_03410 [Dehalococcoidia bacterium]